MKIIKFDCTKDSDDREHERQIFSAFRLGWFYVTVDPRTGERVPLVPLGVSASRLDNALAITQMLDDVTVAPDGGSNDPIDGVFQLDLRDSEHAMLTQYWDAYMGQRGHPAHADHFKRVKAKLAGAMTIEDKKWKRMQAAQEDETDEDRVDKEVGQKTADV